MKTIREGLAEALHKNSYYGKAMPWDLPEGAPEKLRRSEVLADSTKQSWREMADRFIAEIAPQCGIQVIALSPEQKP